VRRNVGVKKVEGEEGGITDVLDYEKEGL